MMPSSAGTERTSARYVFSTAAVPKSWPNALATSAESANTRTPLVPRSRRCTGKTCAPMASPSRVMATSRSGAQPRWTAKPAGLSATTKWSSRQRMRRGRMVSIRLRRIVYRHALAMSPRAQHEHFAFGELLHGGADTLPADAGVAGTAIRVVVGPEGGRIVDQHSAVVQAIIGGHGVGQARCEDGGLQAVAAFVGQGKRVLEIFGSLDDGDGT